NAFGLSSPSLSLPTATHSARLTFGKTLMFRRAERYAPSDCEAETDACGGTRSSARLVAAWTGFEDRARSTLLAAAQSGLITARQQTTANTQWVIRAGFPFRRAAPSTDAATTNGTIPAV